MRRPFSSRAFGAPGSASACRRWRPLIEDPVHEPELERPAVPHAADAAVRQGVDGDHGRQVGRVHLGQRVLGTPGIARAERTDLAVGPGLAGDPLDDVVAVLGSSAMSRHVPSLAYRPRMSLATTL